MRFVVITAAMALSIDPDASSTNTMSSGVVAVSERFEVDDNAVSAVRKSAPFSLDTVMPFLLISLSDTVLSVRYVRRSTCHSRQAPANPKWSRGP